MANASMVNIDKTALKMAMCAKGYNSKQLSEEIGRSRNYISGIIAERGVPMLPAPTLRLVAKILDVDENTLKAEKPRAERTAQDGNDVLKQLREITRTLDELIDLLTW